MRIGMLTAVVTTTLATVLWLGSPSGHGTLQPETGELTTPDTQTDDMALLEDGDAFDNLPDPSVVDNLTVARGDTLMALLVRGGVDRSEAHEAVAALKKVYNPRDIRPGVQVTVTRHAPEPGQDPMLQELDLEVASTRRVAVTRGETGGFEAAAIDTPLTATATKASGTIHSSLYVAGTRASLPANTLASMIKIFSYDVDFQRDVQPGDSFDMMYERMVDDAGNALAEGEILIAEMVLSGKKIRLYRHETADGEIDYFDARGRSSRKALIMTPIDGARISSGYGRRKHPILGYTKMHRGTDFAAPSGTPIYAAGNGVVELAGRNGGYGHYIRIRHNGTYKTAYAHLRNYAKGIAAGKRVKQGEVIGYVGTSGRSTGPHLHYEILIDNKQVNPKTLNLPSGRTLTGKELARFNTMRDALEDRYAALPPADTQLATGD
ncbi:MAG: peptidoglycan DD-metalloendopeptidase family protein [Alphaproteobacteria bacterium]